MQMDDFQHGLDRLVAVKHDMADSLRRVSGALVGSQQQTAIRLANQIASIKTGEQFLADANIATIALGMLTQSADSNNEGSRPSKAETEAAIASWLEAEPIRGSQAPRLIVPSLGPLAVLWLAVILMGLIAVFLVPMFERMFHEFGLSLPAPTLALFGLSSFLRSGGWVALLITLLAATAWSYWRWKQRVGHSNARRTLAEWAWHCAMVSDTGATAQQSVEVVSRLPWPIWTQRFSGYLLDLYRSGNDPFAQLREVRSQRCDLLAGAMQLDPPSRRSETLRAVARLYAELPDEPTGWWSLWGAQLATLVIGLVIAFSVVSLYMPLVELITGLT